MGEGVDTCYTPGSSVGNQEVAHSGFVHMENSIASVGAVGAAGGLLVRLERWRVLVSLLLYPSSGL